MKRRIIAITGGIGAGKSVVSAVLKIAGYGVYDCDQRAKELMNFSPAIRQALVEHFGSEIYLNGTINRQLLSNIIFNDSSALAFVNSVVHPAVRADIKEWTTKQHRMPAFVETAILKEGGLDAIVDEVWNVTAPLETRISRVMRRNATTRDKVLERIATQHDHVECPGTRVIEIVNDDTTALLPQILHATESDN
jgi:dephospho-CoA kinase